MPKLNPRKCDRCDKRITWETWIHSNWSNNYYCRDLDACAVRAKRRRGKQLAQSAIADCHERKGDAR